MAMGVLADMMCTMVIEGMGVMRCGMARATRPTRTLSASQMRALPGRPVEESGTCGKRRNPEDAIIEGSTNLRQETSANAKPDNDQEPRCKAMDMTLTCRAGSCAKDNCQMLGEGKI